MQYLAFVCPRLVELFILILFIMPDFLWNGAVAVGFFASVVVEPYFLFLVLEATVSLHSVYCPTPPYSAKGLFGSSVACYGCY